MYIKSPYILLLRNLRKLLVWRRPQMFESTFDVVSRLVEKWVPKKQYCSEEGYRNDLYNYLRKKLSSEGTDMLGLGLGAKRHVIKKEVGRHLADIGIDDEIGIELKLNFKRQSQKDRLVGQIKRFLKSYRYVIVVLCGEIDEGKVDELQQDFIGYQPTGGIFSPGKIVKIVCKTERKLTKKKPQDLFDIELF